MNTYQFEQKNVWAKAPMNFRETSTGFLLSDGKYFQPQNQNKDNNIITQIILIILRFIFLPSIIICILMFGMLFLFILPIAGIIWIIIFLLNQRYRNNIFGRIHLVRPKVLLSTYPLKLGEKCNLTFHRPLRINRKTKQPVELNFKLVCLERVQYSRGSDIEIDVNVIWESQPQTHYLPKNINTLSLETIFTVPNHLPPSFEGKKNQIRWILSIEQNIPGIVKQVYSNFVIVVDPVVVA